MTNEKDRALALSIPLGVSCVCDIAHAGSICDKHQRIAAALATVRKEEREAVFKEAIEIVDRLVCDPEYDGNWRNGYGHAQNDMQDALEQAAEK